MKVPAQPISGQTLKRGQHVIDIWSSELWKRPLLTAFHKPVLLQWAQRHQKFTLEDWKRVTSSDESRFCLYSNEAMKSKEVFHSDCDAV